MLPSFFTRGAADSHLKNQRAILWSPRALFHSIFNDTRPRTQNSSVIHSASPRHLHYSDYTWAITKIDQLRYITPLSLLCAVMKATSISRCLTLTSVWLVFVLVVDERRRQPVKCVRLMQKNGSNGKESRVFCKFIWFIEVQYSYIQLSVNLLNLVDSVFFWTKKRV